MRGEKDTSRSEDQQQKEEEYARLLTKPNRGISARDMRAEIGDLLTCFDGRKINWTAAKVKGFAGVKIIKQRTESCGNVDYKIFAVLNAPTRKIHHFAWHVCDVKQQVDLLTADEYKILLLKLLKKTYGGR